VRRSVAAVALLLAALGCGSESGPDGSSPAGASGGPDPAADGDGDWLNDAEEAARGTDPADADTDDDGYLDGDEVLEGTDPLDPESRIYQGGWPYQRLKDDIPDPGFEGSPEVGALVPRFVAYDQFGELVELYDFANHGRQIVIDMSAAWCGPCKEVATWLEGEPSPLDDKPELAGIPAMVAAGEIYWITVVFEDAFGNPADKAQAAAWADEFPNPAVLVLADSDRMLHGWLFPGAMPSIQLVDEDMTLRSYDRFDYEVALQALLE
jgi:thiol-disulfide isomerase/thioredoxin